MRLRDRRGIALVIVLGMLTLMIMLAVAFSVYMRTERTASGNYLVDVRARNLLQAALARAMGDINQSMVSSNTVYPPWDVLASRAATNDFGWVPVVLTMEARRMIPMGAFVAEGTHDGGDGEPLQVTTAVTNGIGTVVNITDGSFSTITRLENDGRTVYTMGPNGNELQGGILNRWAPGDEYRILSAQWLPVTTAEGDPNGRIAYLVINCSGLLDANFAGGTNRSIGALPAELQVAGDWIPEVRTLGFCGRSYETLAQFSTEGTAQGWLASSSILFTAFSAYPQAYPAGTNIAIVDLSGDETILEAKRGEIIAAFIASGIDAANAPFVFTNLLDYVDADCIPRSLSSPCTEAVPMLNEVAVQAVGQFRSDGQCRYGVRLNFELFYPFVKAREESFVITWSADFSGAAGTDANFIPAATGGVTAAWVPTPRRHQPFTATAYGPQGPNWFSYTGSVGKTVQVTARVRAQVRLNNAFGDMVDAAPYPTNNPPLDVTYSFVVPAVPSSGETRLQPEGGAECIDPRFNWDCNTAAGGTHWRRYHPSNPTNTLGLLNFWTGYFWSNSMPSDCHADMYVADQPLRQVGELSYLLRGMRAVPGNSDQWNTIRLCDQTGPRGFQPHDTILDHFTVRTNAPTKGYVNANTRISNVVTCVFVDMPVDNYPEESGTLRLTEADARAIADWWVRNSGTLKFPSEMGRLTNLIYFVEADLGFPSPDNPSPLRSRLGRELTPFERESIIRNSAGLMHTRQNLFVILLFAEVFQDLLKPDGTSYRSILSGQRALAEVWRDPWENEDGKHPCFIRYFKILKE